MRTLKKALSLVLVLAMVFALAVPGFAADTTKKASDFKDYSKVTNKEAVDVMTAIGVINGNADGTFAPEGNFTRAEAATMITYLTLGKTVADALPTGATQFTDVPATHWAAKYVQYCAQEGIVAGVGNGKFDPDAKLTATQWALMLLGALGYNAKNEGIGGEGWELATTRLAMKAGVATAEELTATFNRDMAAKFALNTLTATMVEYKTTGTSITIGDTTINTAASAATPVAGSEAAGANYDGKTGDGKMQFCEDHFKTLKLGSTTDDFGRTANVWKLGTATVATYAKAADLTYTTTVKGSTLYKDLGLAKTLSAAVTYNVNGKSASITGYDSINKTAAWTFGGKGTVTEVFKTVDDNGDITALNIVETQTFISKVEKVTKATATTERTVTIEGNKTFTTNEFAVGDYVLYTMAKDKIQSMKAATVAATGKVTAVNSTTGKESFVVDGKTYEYSATNNEKATIGKTATLYLDNYGYVIKDTGAAATTTNYAVVIALGKKADSYYGNTDMAKLVLTDGTVVDAEYKVAEGSTLSSTNLTSSNTKGVIVSYTISNDVYTLTPITGNEKVTGMTTNKAELATSDTSKVYADSKTIFVVRSGDSEKNYTYKAYTGIANVPSMTGATATTACAAGTPAIAKVVYITAGTDAGTTANKAVFVTSTGAQVQKEYAADGKTVLEFVVQNAIVDGKVTTIKVKGSTVKDTGVYASITTDSNGLATLGANVAAATAPAISNKAVYTENGILHVGTDLLGFNADAVCYTVESTGAISEGTIAGLSDQDTKYDGYYTLKDGIVTGLYIYVHTA